MREVDNRALPPGDLLGVLGDSRSSRTLVPKINERERKVKKGLRGGEEREERGAERTKELRRKGRRRYLSEDELRLMPSNVRGVAGLGIHFLPPLVVEVVVVVALGVRSRPCVCVGV